MSEFDFGSFALAVDTVGACMLTGLKVSALVLTAGAVIFCTIGTIVKLVHICAPEHSERLAADANAAFAAVVAPFAAFAAEPTEGEVIGYLRWGFRALLRVVRPISRVAHSAVYGAYLPMFLLLWKTAAYIIKSVLIGLRGTLFGDSIKTMTEIIQGLQVRRSALRGNAEAHSRRRLASGADSEAEANVLERVINDMQAELRKLICFRVMIMLFIGASVCWIAARLYSLFEAWFLISSVAVFGSLGASLFLSECTLIPEHISETLEIAFARAFARVSGSEARIIDLEVKIRLDHVDPTMNRYTEQARSKCFGRLLVLVLLSFTTIGWIRDSLLPAQKQFCMDLLPDVYESSKPFYWDEHATIDTEDREKALAMASRFCPESLKLPKRATKVAKKEEISEISLSMSEWASIAAGSGYRVAFNSIVELYAVRPYRLCSYTMGAFRVAESFSNMGSSWWNKLRGYQPAFGRYQHAADLFSLANGVASLYEWNSAAKIAWGVNLALTESKTVLEEVQTLKALIFEAREAERREQERLEWERRKQERLEWERRETERRKKSAGGRSSLLGRLSPLFDRLNSLFRGPVAFEEQHSKQHRAAPETVLTQASHQSEASRRPMDDGPLPWMSNASSKHKYPSPKLGLKHDGVVSSLVSSFASVIKKSWFERSTLLNIAVDGLWNDSYVWVFSSSSGFGDPNVAMNSSAMGGTLQFVSGDPVSSASAKSDVVDDLFNPSVDNADLVPCADPKHCLRVDSSAMGGTHQVVDGAPVSNASGWLAAESDVVDDAFKPSVDSADFVARADVKSFLRLDCSAIGGTLQVGNRDPVSSASGSLSAESDVVDDAFTLSVDDAD